MLDTIQSVSDKIDTLARELPTLRGQIANHTARLVLAHWHPKNLTLDAEKLNRSHKTLHYNAGMVDENTLQQIFRLDSIQTENDAIRAARKAAVKKGNEVIKASAALREKMDRWKRWLPKWEAKLEENVPMEDVATNPAAAKQQQQPSTQQKRKGVEEESAMKDSESDEEQHQPQTRRSLPPSPPSTARTARTSPQQSSRPRPSTASPSPAAANASVAGPPALSALEKKYAHLRLPTYAGPRFQASVNPRTGELVVEADLEGIDTEDLSIETDAKERTITVRGVRLPERRRSVPSSHPFGGFFGQPMMQPRVAPFGIFKKVISLDEVDPQRVLDFQGLKATMDSRGVLSITVPRIRVIPVHQSRPVAAPPRRPVQHSTWFEDEPDEPEEEVYARPYGARQYPAQYMRPAPQPVYRRPMASPFYSSFF